MNKNEAIEAARQELDSARAAEFAAWEGKGTEKDLDIAIERTNEARARLYRAENA